MTRARTIAFTLCLAPVLFLFSGARAEITSPRDFIGHRVGADYRLARWEKIVAYFQHVAENSPRVVVRELGRSTEGAPLILAEISDAAIIASLDRHRVHQRKIADPRQIEDAREERRLRRESPVVILVNCNLHSTEVASSQMAMELLHDLATGESPAIREILEGTIVLLIPSANPDGLDRVIDWYERSRDRPWEGGRLPWLYQRYAGHDNNRDWFMLALQETRLITRVLYREWFPTIVYDVHQMGNSSARFFVPPFHDPKNANVHPVIDQSLLIIGGHMAAELARAGKKGVVHGAMYDNWWAGGFRTTPYRHNMVGILTEAASPRIATPVFQQKSELRGARRGLPSYALTTNFPDPWPGGWWRLRDVVEYEKIACMSLFRLAARYREMFQGNYISMGREAIRRGRTEPPFAWLVPRQQRDPGTASRMLTILHATGLEIHEAREDFVAAGMKYPAGTFILHCAQPYRPHLMDMMERQVYPDRSSYPDGPPEAPYDTAGWTLPLQMNVEHAAVAGSFDCPTRKLDSIPHPESRIVGAGDASRYLLLPGSNDDFRLLNRIHRAEIPARLVTRDTPLRPRKRDDPLHPSLRQRLDEDTIPAGAVVIENGELLRASRDLLDGVAVTLHGFPASDAVRLRDEEIAPPRVGLYQPWTASMSEGWTRRVLEEFEFSYSTVHNAEMRAGNLDRRFDCLILPSMGTRQILDGRAPDTTSPEYVGGIGKDGLIHLQDFVHSGGTLICLDESSSLPIDHFNIPVRNILSGVDSKEFFCPGSILRISVDSRQPVGFGLPRRVPGFFKRSQAFEVGDPASEAEEKKERDKKDPRSPASRFPARVIARYADTVLLESGWIRGGDRIADKPAVVEVKYGRGRIVLLGFRVQHRAQPHGTFRFLFNAIQRSTLKAI